MNQLHTHTHLEYCLYDIINLNKLFYIIIFNNQYLQYLTKLLSYIINVNYLYGL